MVSTAESLARPLAIATLLLAAGTPMAARAQSVLQCKLISESSELSVANWAADVSDGYLRLLLERSIHSDGPSSVYDFKPFNRHRSVYTDKGDGDNANPEFWMATVEAGGWTLIDRWVIYQSGATHDFITLQCPPRAP